MFSGCTPECRAAARASPRRIRPLICCTSGESTCPGFLCRRNSLDVLFASLFDRFGVDERQAIIRRRNRRGEPGVVIQDGNVAGRLIGHVNFVSLFDQADQRAAHRNHIVIRVRARRSARAWDTDASLRGAARCRSARGRMAGLPPGHPVIVFCIARKTSMLMS